jgi:hypothetical protein
MAMASESTGSLDIGRVIQQIFGVLGRNIVTFGVLAVLLTGIPTAVIYSVQAGLVRSADPAQVFGPRFGYLMLGAFVAGMFGLILQCTIIYGTVNDLNDRKVSIGESLSVGLRAFLPVLALGIMLGIAVALGFVLLIVPGIMLAVAWCVAIPAYVVERPGIMEAFGRSAELTRGNRWAIFGLFVIYMIAAIVIQLVVTMIGGVASFAAGGGPPLISRVLLMPLVQVVSTLVASTGAAVLYAELRRVREGVGAADLARIFD